jgi:hypothetical protein
MGNVAPLEYIYEVMTLEFCVALAHTGAEVMVVWLPRLLADVGDFGLADHLLQRQHRSEFDTTKTANCIVW